MKRYAVIGSPVEHSFSPEYFKVKFNDLSVDAEYIALDVEAVEDIRTIAESHDLAGFNVTVPYKQAIIPYLRHISRDAVEMNAVNVVKIVDGEWYGFNTDHQGFSRSIEGVLKTGYKALVFGSGGSSKAVTYALQRMNIPFRIVSRNEGFTYADLDSQILSEHQLLINTTPLGMYPKVDEAVSIDYDSVGKQHLCFDLVYNPDKSLFLKRCEERGASIRNGRTMLEIQADLSWDIWCQ